MSIRKSTRLMALTTLAAFAVANGPVPNATSATAHVGTAHGTWQLPIAANNGWIDGDLFAITPAPTPTPAYHFTATLIASPVACPACVAGTIHGVLDDGVPGTPNLSVVGNYSGAWATGSGTFSAHIFQPTSTAPIGWIQGTFVNPPILPVLGTFDAKWTIR